MIRLLPLALVASLVVGFSGGTSVAAAGACRIHMTGAMETNSRFSQVLDAALPDLFENRAAIEQAKGVLMYVYRVSAEQAFRVLQWRSQETNVKLRALARQLLAEVATLGPPTVAAQSQFDHLLLTVHERIPADPAG